MVAVDDRVAGFAEPDSIFFRLAEGFELLVLHLPQNLGLRQERVSHREGRDAESVLRLLRRSCREYAREPVAYPERAGNLAAFRHLSDLVSGRSTESGVGPDELPGEKRGGEPVLREGVVARAKVNEQGEVRCHFGILHGGPVNLGSVAESPFLCPVQPFDVVLFYYLSLRVVDREVDLVECQEIRLGLISPDLSESGLGVLQGRNLGQILRIGEPGIYLVALGENFGNVWLDILQRDVLEDSVLDSMQRGRIDKRGPADEIIVADSHKVLVAQGLGLLRPVEMVALPDQHLRGLDLVLRDTIFNHRFLVSSVEVDEVQQVAVLLAKDCVKIHIVVAGLGVVHHHR